ncbi:MAG: hypothetical protein BWY29_00957 [Microgenomates group bacterium ADurb.Bin238]|nr:MAG: hypothetical protein BWY29_00957 [Microgenomates group bacterium ADurb.Bin238]
MAVELIFIQPPDLYTPTLEEGGNLLPNTTYYYSVVAVEALGADLYHYNEKAESARSNIVQVTTTDTHLSARVSWSEVAPISTNSMNYILLRSRNKDDLLGKENVRIMIDPGGHPQATTKDTFYLDDNSINPETRTSSYFWYRRNGDPLIQNTGFTTASPATMETLYAADLAGSLELLPSASAPGTHYLKNPVNPADSLQLKLTLVVTDFSSDGDTDETSGSVTITGTDAGSDIKSEVINISGNGNYESTLSYADVSKLVSTISNGNFNFKVIQNRWGFIWALPDNETNNINPDQTRFRWKINCGFEVTGAFFSSRESITQIGYFQPNAGTASSFQLGVLSDKGYGHLGSSYYYATRKRRYGSSTSSMNNVRIYGSFFYPVNPLISPSEAGLDSHSWDRANDMRKNFTTSHEIIDSIYFSHGDNSTLLISKPVMVRATFQGSVQGRGTGLTYDFKQTNLLNGYIVNQVNRDSVYKNLNVYADLDIYQWTTRTFNCTYVNCTFHSSPEAELYNEPLWYYINYTQADIATFKNELALQITDKQGNPVEAEVIVSHAGGQLTDTGSQVSFEVIYSLYNFKAGSKSGVYFATGNRGNLSPVHPLVTVTYPPVNLTIKAPGYQTYTSELDMRVKRDLVIKLEKAVEIVTVDDDLALNTDPKNPQSDFFVKL